MIHLKTVAARLPATVAAATLVACTGSSLPKANPALPALPRTEEFCLAAERVVSHARMPMQLVVHGDFDAFVRSKASITGPTLQQFTWTDAAGNPLGISCKLKSSDQLLQVFGPGSAGPDGNRRITAECAAGSASMRASCSPFQRAPCSALLNQNHKHPGRIR